VPQWFKQSSRPLRIWSSACATGEEPYSIAIALNEAGWGSHPIQIIGSDASEAALAKARGCFYRERSFRNLPLPLREKYFLVEKEGQRLRPEIASRVSFHWANLISLDELPDVARVDVIFCRNVFIYFSPEAIKQVVAAFARRMQPGGYLFIGASESLLKLTTKFELQDIAGAFTYVRTGEPA
jgi:chemotaxis protein methyltransferase CheR